MSQKSVMNETDFNHSTSPQDAVCHESPLGEHAYFADAVTLSADLLERLDAEEDEIVAQLRAMLG